MNNIKQMGNTILAIILLGVCDFLATTLFQDVMHTPLFLDTIFMMTALFMLGPVPAFLEYLVFIGLTCIKLKILYGKTGMVYLYSLSALTIIIVTWLFVRKKERISQDVNHTFLYILCAAVLAGFACSVVSGLISCYTYPLNVKDWAFDRIIFAFSDEQAGLLSSAIFGRIPVIVPDRVITTFAGFGIFKLYTHIVHSFGRRFSAGVQADSDLPETGKS